MTHEVVAHIIFVKNDEVTDVPPPRFQPGGTLYGQEPENAVVPDRDIVDHLYPPGFDALIHPADPFE